MTENAVIPKLFAPMRGCSITCEGLMRERTPCAYSNIVTESGADIGKIEFYNTPAGTVVNASVYNLPDMYEDYLPLFMEIDDKEAPEQKNKYRIKTKRLPPVFVKEGKGSVSFLTDLLKSFDLIGRRLVLKKQGETKALAYGSISEAFITR